LKPLISFNFLDVYLVAFEKIGLFTAAKRANSSVFNGFIGLFAAFAKCYGRKLFNFQFSAV
jgi:membrane-associated protease RseP (regulator of RpoE activity)